MNILTEEQKESRRINSRRYYHAHKEQSKLRNSKWRENNKEYIITKQREDKRNRKIKCKFKKFKHLEESIDAYFKTLQAERYKKQNIFSHTKTLDYEQQILGIKKAGYATSSEYARRINQFIQKHELYKYDIEYRNATLHNE